MVLLLERLEVRRGSDPGPDVCLVVLVSFCDGSSALVFHDILKSTASYLVKRPSTCVCLPFAYSWIEVELFGQEFQRCHGQGTLSACGGRLGGFTLTRSHFW